MYFLATRSIEHPETLEVIVQRMAVLSIEDVRRLAGDFGVDTIPCVICQDMRAVESMTRDMMSGRL
jgi:hypothetical protein